LVLGACSTIGKTTDFAEERDVYGEGLAPMPAAEAPAMDPSASFSGTVDNAASPPSAERLVIKNASLSVVVDDPQSSMASIGALAESMGGFVVSSYLYQSTLASGIEVPSASITIRVPAERLQDALAQIEGSAIRVLSRNESGQDVTAEYTDLQSRLRNLQDAETLLRQIMQDAEDTEDILNAFNQLNYITEQIEVLKGQIQYYEESATMSAISVELVASQSVQPITIAGWEPVGVAKDAIQALVNALQGLVNLLIWLALYVLPIVLVIGLPLWLIIRGLRAWSARRAGKAPKRRK
jgi:hypothetical protein